jgi:hypothetical protein
MSNKAEGADTVHKRNWPLTIAILATIALLIVFVMVWINKDAWSLEANAFGDFVAGFGSLLAFIWLVAAVFLQMAELRLQRAELEMQREETKGLRAANEEQAQILERQQITLEQSVSVERKSYLNRRFSETWNEILTIETQEKVYFLILAKQFIPVFEKMITKTDSTDKVLHPQVDFFETRFFQSGIKFPVKIYFKDPNLHSDRTEIFHMPWIDVRGWVYSSQVLQKILLLYHEFRSVGEEDFFHERFAFEPYLSNVSPFFKYFAEFQGAAIAEKKNNILDN